MLPIMNVHVYAHKIIIVFYTILSHSFAVTIALVIGNVWIGGVLRKHTCDTVYWMCISDIQQLSTWLDIHQSAANS